jgi:hypothetical protein
MVTVVTIFFLPWVAMRSPDAALATTYVLLLPVKLLHLHLLYTCSKARDPLRTRYSFSKRTIIIIAERLIRISSSYFMSFNYDRQEAQRRMRHAVVPGIHGILCQVMDVFKHLILGTGSTVMLWHAFCLTTVWAAEGVLLLPLVLMCLNLRTVPTAHYLQAFPRGSYVHAGKTAAAAVCSAACRAALPLSSDSSRTICELGLVPGVEVAVLEKHLVCTLIILLQYLVPLYIRWVVVVLVVWW